MILFIFCEANYEHLRNLRCLFLCFEAVLGLKINLLNPKIIPIGEVVDVESLARIIGCRVALLPMKYLGLLGGGRRRRSNVLLTFFRW
jgi:hypothetical protein